MAARYGALPFQEQIEFFRGKVPVPTARWNDLVREQHDIGFMVAGALKADLLADLQGAVDKAIAGGTTLREFQADFERIVRNRGWTGWRGERTEAGRAWRAGIIYETNLRTSYQAGRWAQIQAVKADRPYLLYKHSDAVTHPRPLHVSWDGLIVAADDPWVKPHWPPNGWGCRCRMLSLSAEDLRARGKSGPDTPPDDGTDEWIDRKTGEVHEFPKGIDPFWDYAPGASRTDTLRQQLERKAAALPPAIAADLRSEVASIATPRPVPAAFSTNPKLDAGAVLDTLLDGLGEQGRAVRTAIDRHEIKSVFLSQAESTPRSQAAHKIKEDLSGFLGDNRLSTYQYGIRSRRALGFTHRDWRHIVIRTKDPKKLGTDTLSMAESVAKTLTAVAENAGPFNGKNWAFPADTAPETQGLMIWAHELGHQLHYRASQRLPQPPAVPAPTAYGNTNGYEWHAEGFVAWLFNRPALRAYNEGVADYFDRLMADVTGE